METTLNNLDTSKELNKVQKEIQSLENKLSKLVDMRVDDIIDKETYEIKYIDITTKIEKLKSQRMNLQISVDEKNDLQKKMRTFKTIYEKNEPIKEFDRFVFDSVVEKIILGKTDENGVKKQYVITFVFKTGFRMDADGEKKRKETKKVDIMCSHSADDTR